MKTLLGILLILSSVPLTASAQDVPGVGHRPLVGKSVADKKFWTVNTFLIGSTIYDMESTYFALDKCGNGCRERNPLMRPFVKAGRPALYAIQGSLDAGIIYASYKLKKEDKKLWWLLPVVVTAAHSVAGTHNVRIAIRF